MSPCYPAYMLKHGPPQHRVWRLHLTWMEGSLIVGAAILLVAALTQLSASPALASATLLAAVTIASLIAERISTRHTLETLADELSQGGPLRKQEIAVSGSTIALNQAINRVIQQQQRAEQEPESQPFEHRQTVAVLAFGLRQDAQALYTAPYAQRLAQIATLAREISRTTGAVLRTQDDGTLLLIFSAAQQHSIRTMLRDARIAAHQLATCDADLRFGLSYGQITPCPIPDLETVLVGAPIEDALRLARMAFVWHEYQLLCPEPIALVIGQTMQQRTTLELVRPTARPQPVYALDLTPRAAAVSA